MANLNLSSEEIHNPNIVNPNIGSISSQRNIATLVSRVLENKETTTKVIQNEFINLFSKNIQIGIQAVNKFHDEFKKKLNKLPKIEHLPAVEWVTKTFENLFSNLALKTLNINWDSALKWAKSTFNESCNSKKISYHNIQENLCTQITGKWFPTQTAN